MWNAERDLQHIAHADQTRSVRVFVPMCGASRDLKAVESHLRNGIAEYGATKGGNARNYRPTVFGVEQCKSALQYLFNRDYEGSFEKMEYDTFSKTEIYRVSSTIRILLGNVLLQCVPRLVLQVKLSVYQLKVFVCTLS